MFSLGFFRFFLSFFGFLAFLGSDARGQPKWAGGDSFVFEVRLVRSPPHTDATGGAADAAGGGSELSVQVHLCEGHGAAAASFWAWAERLRNDVIRDTRKWRRLAAREAKPKHNE